MRTESVYVRLPDGTKVLRVDHEAGNDDVQDIVEPTNPPSDEEEDYS